ncbi:uncharacterized protein BP5553_09113 [Venustampulla echinocandica]|uniref:Uncharacterized protein n=1 Tax=Venustampulla echinocandica TaxID=2656787 RepID=A0A370TDY5_9HELO|nr:uncharacterized protein BP5553_09113 [Venustampulla echinocandica]RDL32657.1 hypothetical protein BP5553_09113 [Venustampulla echinocandica]
MASTATYSNTAGGAAYSPNSSDDERAAGGRKAISTQQNLNNSSLPQLPTSDGLRAPAGGLLRGAVDDNGKLKNAGLMVGIKLDLEAEVHLTARIRGDIVIGLY